MKILNQKELQVMERFLQLRQATLLKAMKRYLQSTYKEVIVNKNYLIAIGDIPVALVAHLDTVLKAPPEDIFYDRVKNIIWSPGGLGADDRAGVYSIIQIIKSGLRPTVIFTTDEEIGCIGAEYVVNDFPKPPTELKYIIELDRRGSNDCVFYSCDNSDFEEYVENFGFVTNYGSFSDISVICPMWEIAGVNLSIGYYNEHTSSEFLHVGQMLSTIKRVKKMLLDVNNAKSFQYIEVPYNRWLSYYNLCSDVDIWDPSYGIAKEEWDKYMSPQSKCNHCGKWDYDYNMFPAKHKDGVIIFCSDCISSRKDVHWCNSCGEAFMDETQLEQKDCFCDNCRVINLAKQACEKKEKIKVKK